MKNLTTFLVIAILLPGCSSFFQKPDSCANYGTPPVNYEEKIKQYFELVLIDPESARYRFSQPIKAYENEGLISGGKVCWLGYLVETQVNAKNQLGGYVGYQPYVVLFKSNEIYRVEKRDIAYDTSVHRVD